ncbi:MAG TPA: DinB family protein, partial [Dehalococcoidia bacterium]|nr:DinB family protein [Dehalococcoidia bacterium]
GAEAGDALAPTEIVCILRDAEQLFADRFAIILAGGEPQLPPSTSPDRWPEERAYLSEDAVEALAAFRQRRAATLAQLQGLPAADWQRAGVHPQRGRLSIDDLVAMMAWHDEHRVAQLTRSLSGGARDAADPGGPDGGDGRVREAGRAARGAPASHRGRAGRGHPRP